MKDLVYNIYSWLVLLIVVVTLLIVLCLGVIRSVIAMAPGLIVPADALQDMYRVAEEFQGQHQQQPLALPQAAVNPGRWTVSILNFGGYLHNGRYIGAPYKIYVLNDPHVYFYFWHRL